MLLLFCLFTPPRLTLSLASTPLPIALIRIGEATDLKLEASPALVNRTLLMRVRDVEIPVLLEKIADIQNAEWVTRTDGTRVLKPDVAKGRAFQAEFDAHAADILNRSREYVRKRLSQQSATFGKEQALALKKKLAEEEAARKRAEEAKDYAKMFVASTAAEEQPGWRALARILPTIPNSELLSMRWSGQEVWAERPTQLQHPFNLTAQRALRTYREELLQSNPEIQVERVEVTFTRWEHGECHNLSMEAFDGAMHSVDRAFIRLAGDSDQMKIPYDQRHKAPEPKAGEKPIELDPEAEEFQRVIRHDGLRPRDEALLRRWLPRLLRPEELEPTQMESTRYLKMAEALDLNMVAIPDELLLVEGVIKPETPSQLLDKVLRRGSMDRDGWLTFRPSYPWYFPSRASAGRLLRSAYARGGVSIEAAASFAAETTEIWPFTCWVETYMAVFCPGGGHGYLGTTFDTPVLKFWAGLRDNQADLLAGRSLNLDRLPEASRYWLNVMIFDDGRVQSKLPPTDLFANGVHGHLIVEEIFAPVLVGWNSEVGEPKTIFAYTPEQFGRRLARSWNEEDDLIPNPATYNRFRVGRERRLKLKFSFDGTDATMEEELGESVFPPDATVLSKLPPEVARAVEAARKAAPNPGS